MNLPISTSSTGGLILSAVFGLVFGVLLQKGGVTNYNVIVNFFRLRDLTVLKVMLTAIVVGGIGVASMMAGGWIEVHVLGIGDYGKVRVGDATGLPELLLYGLLAIMAGGLFVFLERKCRPTPDV